MTAKHLVGTLAVLLLLAAPLCAPAAPPFAETKQGKMELSQITQNPARILGACAAAKGHTLTLLQVELPRRSMAEQDDFLAHLPPGQARRYAKSMALVVIDSAQTPTPHRRVVWGMYDIGPGMPPGGIPQKVMNGIVWQPQVQAAWVVTVKSQQLGTTVSVYRVSQDKELLPLPLVLDFQHWKPALESATASYQMSAFTYETDVNALALSATKEGLEMVCQRERGHDSPVWDTPPYTTPVTIHLNLTTGKWTGSGFQIEKIFDQPAKMRMP